MANGKKVRLSDGRILNFNGNPTQFDIDEAINQIGTGKQEIQSSLPGEARVERLQASRTPAVETLKEELATPTGEGFLDPVIKGGTTALKGAAIPFEAAQASAERAVEGLQEQTPEQLEARRGRNILGSLIPPVAAVGFAKDVGQEAVEGFKGAFTGGEGVPQLGDNIRRLSENKTFGNETAAQIFGLVETFAVTDPLVFNTFSKSIDSLFKLTNAARIKNALRPDVFERIIPQAQKWVNGADEIVGVSGSKVKDLFKGAAGKIKFGKKFTKDLVNKIPEPFRTKLFKEGEELFGIVIKRTKARTKLVSDTATGVRKVTTKATQIIDDAAENIWKVRQYLDDIPTSQEFVVGASNKSKEKILFAANIVRKKLGTISASAKKIMKDYSDIVKRRNFIRNKLIEPKSGFVKQAAKNILKQFQTKAILREMADIVPETAEFVKTLQGANLISSLSKGTFAVGKTAAKIGLLKAALGGTREITGTAPQNIGGGG